MSIYKNSITIRGHLGADPQIVEVEGPGKYVINFSIATTESWFNKKTNKLDEHTEWHSIVGFGEYLHEKIQKLNIKTGDLVEISGKKKTEKWTDKDGNARSTVKIIMTPKDTFTFFFKEQNDDSNNEGRTKDRKVKSSPSLKVRSPKSDSFDDFTHMDDDISNLF